jgi:DNA-3-methyladenine glycosylase I
MAPDLSKPRCQWPGQDPLYVAYHDQEWGAPEYDSKALWAKLVLDGFQAGLAWITILRKREAFRAAFQGFDPDVVASFADADVERLLADPGIVRSRSKILATIGNAKAYRTMQEKGEDFSTFIWSFVGGAPIQNCYANREDVPVATPQSVALSKALKQRGFKFVGPVIVYAFMQAVGMVNDHAPTCFRYEELGGMAKG